MSENKPRCIVCNGPLPNRRYKRCSQACAEKSMPKCMDCGKQLSDRRAKRCKNCAAKAWVRPPKIPQKTCRDCGTPIEQISTRCMKCFHIYRTRDGKLPLETRAKISATLAGTSVEEAKTTLIKRDQAGPADRAANQLAGHLKTGAWKPIGATYVNSKGYIYEKIQHGAGQKNWMVQHRYVMQEYLDRVLTKQEHVHHVDGDKTNNLVENLRLINPREHFLLNKVMQFIADPRGGIRLARIIVKTILNRYPETITDF